MKPYPCCSEERLSDTEGQGLSLGSHGSGTMAGSFWRGVMFAEFLDEVRGWPLNGTRWDVSNGILALEAHPEDRATSLGYGMDVMVQ